MTYALKAWQAKGCLHTYKKQHVFYINEGNGDCLLIIHGYPYSGYDFKYLLPTLSSRFQVIIPDMLGMGFSDKPVNYPYSFEEHVAMYRSLLNHLNINSIHILSHDLGNSVVQELLAQYESGIHSIKIKSIAFLNGGLFSSVYRPRPIQIILSKSPSLIGKLVSKLISKRSIEKATSSVFGKKTKPSKDLLNDFWEILNYKNGKSLAWKIGRLVFEKDIHQQKWIQAMQQTQIPMCFINGPSDPNSGIHMARKYMELIPNHNVKLLRTDIGHWPQIEDSDGVIDAYTEFINQL